MIQDSIGKSVVLLAMGSVLLGGASAFAAPTDAQKCQAAKIKALAKLHLCRQKEEAKAILDGRAPNFTECEAKVQQALDKIDAKFPSGGPTPGCSEDTINRRTMLLNLARRDAGDMACRLKQDDRVERVERSGSIVFVDFYRGVNSVLSLRHPSNIPIIKAQCFYASDGPTCIGSPEFVVEIPRQGEVSWPADTGTSTIPAAPAGITYGFLVCVAIDDSGIPFAPNSLIASVTDEVRCGRDGLPILGSADLFAGAFNSQLCMGAPVSTDCPVGAEYEACPFHPNGSGGSMKPLIEGCWNTISSFTFHCQ